MVPMRSVPHRVVCLVGLDDGVFPRTRSTDGDDVLARDPLTGERDPRSEDRQLLLDAVLAASETLVVTYTGANEHTGAARARPPYPSASCSTPSTAPPPAPVRDARAGPAPAAALRRPQLRARAPRHAEPFSFDPAALAGALAPRPAPDRRRPLFLAGRSPSPAPATTSTLADLQAFFAPPGARRSCAAGSTSARRCDADEVDDAMPVELDALEEWAVGDRLLRDVLAGADPRRGAAWPSSCAALLPPGRARRRRAHARSSRSASRW